MKRFSFAQPAPADAEIHGTLKIQRLLFGDKPAAKAWRGKQTRPYAFHCWATEQAREAWIEGQIKADQATTAWKAQRDSDRKAEQARMRHTIKPGMLLHGSWGYDQTNCELYQVTDVRGAYAIIRPVRCVAVQGTQGFMAEDLQPVPNEFCGEPLRRMITGSGVKLHEHCTLSPTDATEKHYSSWYA